mgnify:CR=1 FL=1
MSQYRVSMMKGGTQSSQDDVVVFANSPQEAMRKAERIMPGYKACNAYKMS